MGGKWNGITCSSRIKQWESDIRIHDIRFTSHYILMKTSGWIPATKLNSSVVKMAGT